MKLLKYTIFLVPLLVACTKKELKKSEIPDCITNLTELEPSLRIQYQEVNDELHFWLNTSADQVNYDEFIVNEQCDTVCYIPFGFEYDECFDDYDDEWELIEP